MEKLTIGSTFKSSKGTLIEIVEQNESCSEYIIRNTQTWEKARIGASELARSIEAAKKYEEATAGRFAVKQSEIIHAKSIVRDILDSTSAQDLQDRIDASTEKDVYLRLVFRSSKKIYHLEEIETKRNSFVFGDAPWAGRRSSRLLRIEWDKFEQLKKWPVMFDFPGSKWDVVYFLSFNEIEEHLAKKYEKAEREKADKERMEKQQKALEDELEKIKSENTELYGKVREACVWFLQERTKELKVNPDFTSKPAPWEEIIDRESRRILRGLKFIDSIVFPYSEYTEYVKDMQKYNPETSLKPQEEYFRNKVDLRVWCRVLGIVPHESSEKEVKNALQKLKKETLDAPFTNKAGESLEKSAEPDGNITACAKKFKSGDDWYRHEIGETKNHDGLVARAATIEPNVMVVYKSLERMKNGMNDWEKRTKQAWNARIRRINEASKELDSLIRSVFVDYYTENVLGQKVEKPEDRSAIIAEKRSRAREHVLALMKSHEAEAAKEAQLNAVSITKIKRLVLNDDNSTGACIEFGAICTYSDGTVWNERTHRIFLSNSRHERTEEGLADALLSAKTIEDVLGLSEINNPEFGWNIR